MRACVCVYMYTRSKTAGDRSGERITTFPAAVPKCTASQP